MADYNSKKEEFNLWLQEIKNTNIERLSHFAEKQLWEDYMEDYNTATLPSKKYYNLNKWELKQQKRQEKEVKKYKKKSKNILDKDEIGIFNDEADRMLTLIDHNKSIYFYRKEKKEKQEKLQQERFKEALLLLNEDKEKVIN